MGKGKDRRKRVHLIESRCQNTRLKGKIKHIRETGTRKPIIKILNGLSENGAFKIETELILSIGRLDLAEGPLCNHTNGGDGPSGMVVSSKSRKKKSEFFKTLWQDPEYRKKHSKSMKKYWESKEGKTEKEKRRELQTGNTFALGYKDTKEERKRKSERIKKQWKNKE